MEELGSRGFFQTEKDTVAKDGAGGWERNQEWLGVSWGAEAANCVCISAKVMLPWYWAPCCGAFLLGDKKEYDFFNKGVSWVLNKYNIGKKGLIFM